MERPGMEAKLCYKATEEGGTLKGVDARVERERLARLSHPAVPRLDQSAPKTTHLPYNMAPVSHVSRRLNTHVLCLWLFLFLSHFLSPLLYR